MVLATVPSVTAQLPRPSPKDRELVARCAARRLALQGDQQLLRDRYEEVMRWANPPWDAVSRRVDPRAEAATTQRLGENVLHVDLTNPTLDRWAVLQLGAPPIFRVKPTYVRPPVDDPHNPETSSYERQQYDFDVAIAQAQSSQMENQTQEWAEANNFHRTLLWAAWCKEAFGKAIIKTGWDPDEKMPTAELYENPSTVYYGWTKRYGNRKLAWASVIDELHPIEAERRFGVKFPVTSTGQFDYGMWTGLMDEGDLDSRPEQQGERMTQVTVAEYWEMGTRDVTSLDLETGIETVIDTEKGVWYALILADRVVDGPTFYPWKRLPFHVFESQHLPTWPHGKSMGEVIIPINAAYDDTLDREHQVIQFEAGPRFKGLNMAQSGDEVDIPAPFHMVPLQEGEDIAQIDVGVDFFPSDVHIRALTEGIHRATGLTPIAWGMSPNAQTSGRALSAEWRAVELPLTGKLINMSPDVRDIVLSWWDYAEAYVDAIKAVGKGYRRFEIIWVPLDIRDRTERSADIINRLQANIVDPATAIEESGYENVDEIMAKIKDFLLDPIWNPLRYQQYLTLQQLELQIRQQSLQVAAMEAQQQQAGQAAGAPGGPGGPSPQDLAQQGTNAAGQAAQGVNPAGEALNQPGQAPGAGLLPVTSSILSQTPLVGGVGNRVIVNPAGGGAPAPTGGQQPR